MPEERRHAAGGGASERVLERRGRAGEVPRENVAQRRHTAEAEEVRAEECVAALSWRRRS